MQQLFSNADDRDVFGLVKGLVEKHCDHETAEIAVSTLADWKARPDEEDDDDSETRIKELEGEVEDLRGAISDATEALENV